MQTDVITRDPSANSGAIQLGTIEQVLAQGDLAKMTPDDRTRYLVRVCETLGLNVYTRPFQYIMLSGKLTLYATRDAADQLRKLHGVSIRIVARERDNDIYTVTAEATDRTGRTDSSIGAVTVAGLKGEALANAYMKCETKAKRRVTLSVCGLGFLDETEVETVPNTTTVAQPALPVPTASRVEPLTGEIIEDEPRQQQRPAAPKQQAAVVEASASTLPTGGRLGKKGLEQWLSRARAQFPHPGAVEQIARDLTGATPETMTIVQAREVMEAIEGSLLARDGEGRYYVADLPPDDEPLWDEGQSGSVEP